MMYCIISEMGVKTSDWGHSEEGFSRRGWTRTSMEKQCNGVIDVLQDTEGENWSLPSSSWDGKWSKSCFPRQHLVRNTHLGWLVSTPKFLLSFRRILATAFSCFINNLHRCFRKTHFYDIVNIISFANEITYSITEQINSAASSQKDQKGTSCIYAEHSMPCIVWLSG